jgi:hypothetical protein
MPPGSYPNRGGQRLQKLPYGETQLARLVLQNTGQQIHPTLLGKYKREQTRPDYKRRKILEKWPGVPPDFWDMPRAEEDAAA